MEDPDISRRLSLSPTSALPLPRTLRQHKSFTQLARFIGFSASDDKHSATDDSGSDADGEREVVDDDQDGEEADEESLMWDAQTALIAHQPALAAKYYATAALPPHSSPAACLALGNLLARGSGGDPLEDDIPPTPTSPKAANTRQQGTPQRSWFSSFFRHQPPAPAPPPEEVDPRPRVKRLASNGWELPTDGKRAVRNVEAMGKAGGWLVLGIALILESESQFRVPRPAEQEKGMRDDEDEDEDGIVVFDFKGKGRARPSHNNRAIVADTTAAHHSGLSTASSETAESLPLNTPEDDHDTLAPAKRIKLLYDLLTPLVQLYRHGHIQRYDPVALPPISYSQLPSALKSKGLKEKGRNTWFLGSSVADMLLDLPLLISTPNLGKDANARRHGVLILANYIRGVTSSPNVAEGCFKRIIRLGRCGLDLPDDLVQQAHRRLKSILKTTGGSPVSDHEPLLCSPPSSTRLHRRRRSNGSLMSTTDSIMSASLRLMTPVKSSASLASLAFDSPIVENVHEERLGALSSLRHIQERQRRIHSASEGQRPFTPKSGRWPALEGWSRNSTPRKTALRTPSDGREQQQFLGPSRPREFESVRKPQPPKPQLRVVASSPQLHNPHLTSPPSTHSSRHLLPFEPKEAVAPIDPELARIELASALTKHVQCSVCGADGVNFPNCRKCGLTFCSRPCRIDEKGAGNGKRHVCGAWESRKLAAAAPRVLPQPAQLLSPPAA